MGGTAIGLICCYARDDWAMEWAQTKAGKQLWRFSEAKQVVRPLFISLELGFAEVMRESEGDELEG